MIRRISKAATATAIGCSLMTPAVAQSECFTGPFGAYGSQKSAFALVMQPPVVGETKIVASPTLARKGLEVAHQEFTIAPVFRYLKSDINLVDDKGRSLAKAVPLAAGSPITTWRDASGERQCSIGWQNGLFGGATGEGHYRWICLEDRDGDGAYDNAWRPKSANMGLSYTRVDMPISPAVAWTDSAPSGQADRKDTKGGALETYVMSRVIEVTSVTPTSIRLQYRGAGVPRDKANRVDLPIDRPGSVTLGGVTVALTSTSNKTAMLAASGAFTALPISQTCQGSSYSIGNFDATVMFNFPNW